MIRNIIISSFILLALICPKIALSAWEGGLSIKHIRLSKTATFVRFTTQPANTCSYYGDTVMFYNNEPYADKFLSVLLSAEASKKRVSIWYEDSTAEGTDQSNGCNFDALSKLAGLSIYQ